VTRRDLPAAVQAVQAAHAALDFAVAHPAVTAGWHAASNTLVLLAVPDELALSWLADDAAAAGHRVAAFREPDLGGALTAVAFEPAAWRLVHRLPLAFSQREEVRT
jgi:hypothetical protein